MSDQEEEVYSVKSGKGLNMFLTSMKIMYSSVNKVKDVIKLNFITSAYLTWTEGLVYQYTAFHCLCLLYMG